MQKNHLLLAPIEGLSLRSQTPEAWSEIFLRTTYSSLIGWICHRQTTVCLTNKHAPHLHHTHSSTNLVGGILPVSICQVSVFPVLYLFFRFPWQSDQDFCLFPHSFPAIILYFEENQDKIPVNFR